MLRGARALFVTAMLLAGTVAPVCAQVPRPVLVGYWHNWNDAQAPFIPLDRVDSRFTVVNIAFTIPAPGTVADMVFSPEGGDLQDFRTAVAALQARGTRVLLSVGGATAPLTLGSAVDRDRFVQSLDSLLALFGFDGVDIDLEGSSLRLTGGSIAAPVDDGVIQLTDAVRFLMARFHARTGRRMLLTMAPETAHVQGGMAAFGGVWGAYLPLIHALRDSLALLHVQLYNSGTMFGVDGGIYAQGTADFIVAMTEAVIRGFPTAGGPFTGLPAAKVAIGLPACASAAGGGYCAPAVIEQAVRYLRGAGPRPGQYILADPGGYPDLAGMMTWSLNWDAATSCGAGSFAETFTRLFVSSTGLFAEQDRGATVALWPQPVRDVARIAVAAPSSAPVPLRVTDLLGRTVYSADDAEAVRSIDLHAVPPGIYLLQAGTVRLPFLRR